MLRTTPLLALIAFVFVAPPSLRAADGAASFAREVDGRFTISLQGVDIKTAVRDIARLTGWTIALDPALDECVDFEGSHVGAEGLIDLLALEAGLDVQPLGPVGVRLVPTPRVSAEFRGCDLRGAVSIIEQVAGVTIECPDVPEVTVDCAFVEVPWREALVELVLTAGYDLVHVPGRVQEEYRVIAPRDVDQVLARCPNPASGHPLDGRPRFDPQLAELWPAFASIETHQPLVDASFRQHLRALAGPADADQLQRAVEFLARLIATDPPAHIGRKLPR